MTPDQLEPTIRQYIDQVIHMSLATCADNKPWVCEVHFAYDDDLNLYFVSMDSRHVQELTLNPQVAGNIVTQHFKGQPPRGVYFEGRAELVAAPDEQTPGYLAYAGRFGAEHPPVAAILDADNPRQLYKITVSDWYVYDALQTKPPQKYHLAWK